MANEPKDHAIHYVELPATDLAATKAFFERVFGWRFTDYGDAYTSFEEGEPVAGGFYAASEARAGGPLVVVHARDLEGTLDAVREAGGRIVREIFSFPGGRRFHFTDPSGNEWAVSTDP